MARLNVKPTRMELNNLKERLKLIYGNDATFQLSNMADNYGAIVEVRIKLSRIKSPNEP